MLKAKHLIYFNINFGQFKKKHKWVFVIIATLGAGFLIYNLIFWGKVFPGVFIAGNYVGRLTPQEVSNTLSEKIQVPEKVILTYNNEVFEIPLEFVNFSYNYPESAQKAYHLYRTGNFLYDFWCRFQAPFRKVNLGLNLEVDEEKLTESLSVIAAQISIEPIYPSVSFANKQVVVNKGSDGTGVDFEKMRLLVGQNLTSVKNSSIPIPTYSIKVSLSNNEIDNFQQRAQKLVGKYLQLTFEDKLFSYREEEIFSLLYSYGKYNQKSINNLVDKLSYEIDRSPQNPVFTFQNGRVKEFVAAKDGVTVDKQKLAGLLTENLTLLETSDQTSVSVTIPTINTPPDYQTEEVNDLGIKELIGKGSSKFAGSIPSRIHNISVASGHLNGTLVKPGEIFSFNQTVGEISEATGYKQAYIIQEGQTILGDGGGVCQVSTTLFRAALTAGLPIIERRAHAYRVGYYEQDSPPGFDATVYAPTTDLRFKNDTPGHILIQTVYSSKTATLAFEIYGTSDGRIATTTQPIITDITPPPEDLYLDDPTKPTGEIEQIDWKAWGAKVQFDYLVEREGTTLYEKTFYSYFQPWQAKFLRGTGLVY